MRVQDKFRKMFFMLGMGRSGSMFLAKCLNKYTDAIVYHEHRRDRDACVQAYWSEEAARRYLRYRGLVIRYRTKFRNVPVYGEVNSYLRYHVDALRLAWNPVIFHLVRDGRDVVRSIMNRKAYTSADSKHTGRITPKEGDFMLAGWESRDRFEKVCWYWADTNRHLLDKGATLVRFEDAKGSFEYFRQRLLDPLRLEMEEAIWRREKDRPRNVNLSYSFPAWEDWNEGQRLTFERVCGPVMRDMGYEI